MESVRKLTDKHYTYKDYKNWPEGERWEIIDGVAYAMSPSPSRKHQRLTGEIFKQIAVFLTGKPCQVYMAPLDVFLSFGKEKEEEIDKIVQPDIVVVCDQTKLRDNGIKGAPDLVVEVVSPSSGSRDKVEKLNLYEKSGVKEYWIVDADDSTLMVLKLGCDGRYGRPETYDSEGLVKVGVLEGLEVELKPVFEINEE